ncbi:MAG: translocation/assembly module TamB, partial [Rikenellaceae bacterium]|nr:translocation/assembly module TamB [Rikenellaceae bacterium]
DITAIYRLRASGALFGLKQSIPVECKLLLTDRLSQPTINFDIEVPTFDPELQTILQSVMSTNEMKSQQFVWLLMARTFYVDSGEGDLGNIGTTASAATGIEFLTNQLSSWLSTDRFSFNVGYNRSADQTLSDELEGMFSGEIIPNKLLFEGEVNYNLGDKDADPREHQFSGDFYLTYIIGRSGNLHTKVFSRTIDRYDENQGLQEQGIGLYYKRDFNHWWEIFRRQRRWNRMAPSSEEEEVLQAESEHEKPILIEGAIEGAEPFRLLPE